MIQLVKLEEELSVSINVSNVSAISAKALKFSVQQELRRLSRGFFQVASDVELPHLSGVSLKQGLQEMMDLVNLVHCVKSKAEHTLSSLVPSKHSFEVESQVQEAFWVCV